jgi:tetratricopeptide (TPR) repeat protein
LSEERARSIPPVCDNCGHVISSNETKANDQVSRHYKYGMWAFAASVIGLHLFFSQWGGYTLEVRWLQVFGGNGSQERLAQICLETFQYDCVEKHYMAMATQDGKHWLTLGKFQMSRQNYKGATDSFRTYLSQNEDPNKDITFLYARSLSEIGQIDEAAKYYEEIIRSRTDVIPITATQKYVEMLVKAQRWGDAQKIIEEVRKRGENGKDFMQQQYTEITARVRGEKS